MFGRCELPHRGQKLGPGRLSSQFRGITKSSYKSCLTLPRLNLDQEMTGQINNNHQYLCGGYYLIWPKRIFRFGSGFIAIILQLNSGNKIKIAAGIFDNEHVWIL